MDLLGEYYLWIKALHVVAFTSWMSMLFYLPRLFVYHAENIQNDGYTQIVKIQQEKLYRFIGQPAMGLTLITGILMLSANPTLFKSGGWLHLKLFFVVILVCYHFVCGGYVRAFKKDSCARSAKFFRFFNEIPTLCLIVIAFSVVTKAF